MSTIEEILNKKEKLEGQNKQTPYKLEPERPSVAPIWQQKPGPISSTPVGGGIAQQVQTPLPDKQTQQTSANQSTHVDGQQGTQTPADPAPKNLTEIVQKFYKDKLPTEEELEKERKRNKAKAAIAALGDGISAIANLVSTTKYAPNAKQTTMSSKMRERWDKIMAERDANKDKYLNARMRAYLADQAQANADRSFGFQQDEAKRAQGNADRNYQLQKDNIEDNKNYRDKVFNANEEQRKEQNKQAWARINQNKIFRDDANALNRLRVIMSGSRGTLGKKLGFTDGEGNEIPIYENVWKVSMPKLFEQLVKEGFGRREGENDSSLQRRIKKMKDKDKADFVKQYWYKSPAVKDLMMSYSQFNPEAMTAAITEGEEDDFSQYKTGGTDVSPDEFEQYKQ